MRRRFNTRWRTLDVYDSNGGVSFSGAVSGAGITGFTPGAEVYLDAASSKVFTATAPTAGGTVVQPLGFAVSATVIQFNRQRASVN